MLYGVFCLINSNGHIIASADADDPGLEIT